MSPRTKKSPEIFAAAEPKVSRRLNGDRRSKSGGKGNGTQEGYSPWLHREPVKPDRHSQWPVM